jgi:branched-chain amino acid aminotransferase
MGALVNPRDESRLVVRARLALVRIDWHIQIRVGMKYLSKIWLDGETRPWDAGMVHITDLGLPFAQFVFEGVKAYRSEDGHLNLFRVAEHMQRFTESCRFNRLDCRYTPDELVDAAIAMLRANTVQDDVHLRPMAYFSGGELRSRPAEMETHVLMSADLFRSELPELKPVAVCVSSWRRPDDASVPMRVKTAANYHNSRLALTQANTDGYDFPILLNSKGTVAESSGACIFVRRKNVLLTPPVGAGILESITRSTLIELARAEGFEVQEREVDRSELYLCEEAFLCGTGAEVKPITSIDRFELGGGQIGPMTQRLADRYCACVRNADSARSSWLTPV